MNARLTDILRNVRNPRSKTFWMVALLVAYTAAGFLLVPWLIRDQLPGLAQDYIKRDASVAAVSFNPWSLQLEAQQLAVNDETGKALLKLDQLDVNLQVSSLFYRALKFREISLTAPDIQLTRYESGKSNIELLLEDYNAAAAGTAEPEGVASEPLRLIIDQLNINNGRIGITDQVPETAFDVELAPLNIAVENLSTLPNDQGEQIITVVLDGGTEIALSGSLQLNPLLASGSLNLRGSPLPVAQRYLDDQLNFKLRDERFSTSFNFAVRENNDRSLSAAVSDLKLDIEEIRATSDDGEQAYFSIPQIAISGGELAWPEQTLRIAEVQINKPEINIELAADGSLNLEALAAAPESDNVSATAEPSPPPIPAEETAAAEAAPPEAEQDSEDAESDIAVTAAQPAEAADEWRVVVDTFKLQGLSAVFRDLSLKEPGEISIAALDLLINNISNSAGENANFRLETIVASGGRLDASGTFTAVPELSAAAQLDLNELALTAIQPWAADAAMIVVNDGQVSASGQIEVTPAEAFSWKGNVQLRNLDVSDSAANESLAGVRELALSDARFQLSKNEFEVSTIAIDAPFARVVINEDATTNFQQLTTTEAEDDSTAPAKPAAEPADPGEALVVKVGKTTVTNGSVDFSDFSLPLPFRALITEFGGTVSAIATNSAQPSVVDFDGKVGDYGQANVDGSISILDPTSQTEIDLIFRNVNMPDLSPYTVEFAGRTIEEGKLDLDLKYQFADNKMQGDNKVVLTTFKLGEEVESENAMSLPLDIAVALLKDVNGVIDLNLAVKGDLDDPSFSIGGIVLKALANLIIKAAAAPFKLLGSLVPGMGDSEDIGTLRFAAGEAELLPPEREQLDNLAIALGQRPNLTLKIPAGYVAETDTRALQAIAVEMQVDAELASSGNTDDPAQLTERTRKVLERLARDQLDELNLRDYREQFETVSETTGETTFDEVAYMAALRRQLQDRQTIQALQLEELARERQTAVVDYLLAKEAITPARVLAGEIETGAVEEDRYIEFEMELDVGKAPAAPEPAADSPAPVTPADATAQ